MRTLRKQIDSSKHAAGAVRFDTKVKNGPSPQDEERIYNYVRLVRNAE